jgi:hypothetical protein
MSISSGLIDGYVFYDSSSVLTPDAPHLYPVAIQGHGFLIDPRQYRRRTLEAVRQGLDNSSEPGEQTLNSEGLWRRSQENWVLGVGQEFFDARNADNGTSRSGATSSRFRVWKSKGVDHWTEGKLTLLKATELKTGPSSSTTQVLAVGTKLYYTDGTTVDYVVDPTAASFTEVNVDLDSKVPVTMATDGSTIWIACTSTTGIRSTTAGTGTSSAFATDAGSQGITKLAYCNGRLIGASANKLWEVLRAGTTTQIGDPANNNPSFTWTDIVGAPNAIYACGYAGNKGEIYSMSIADDGTIADPVWAAGLPYGEVPYTIMPYAGILVMQISGGVKALDPFGEFCWFGWTSYSSTPATDPTAAAVLSSGLGRMDLGRPTADLIPAYAPDVMATNGVTGAVTSIANISGKRYFSVASSGVWGESTSYVTEGFIQSGLIRYGTVEPKVLVGGDWRNEPLPAGAETGMIVVKDDDTTVTLDPVTVTSARGPRRSLETSLPVGESFKVQMYLQRGSTPTTAPVLLRWTVRSLVTPQRIDEIVLPIIMRSRIGIGSGQGQEMPFDASPEFGFLKSLERTGTIVSYQEGKAVHRVIVDRIEVQPDKFRDDRSFFECLVLVRLLTVPLGG